MMNDHLTDLQIQAEDLPIMIPSPTKKKTSVLPPKIYVGPSIVIPTPQPSPSVYVIPGTCHIKTPQVNIIDSSEPKSTYPTMNSENYHSVDKFKTIADHPILKNHIKVKNNLKKSISNNPRLKWVCGFDGCDGAMMKVEEFLDRCQDDNIREVLGCKCDPQSNYSYNSYRQLTEDQETSLKLLEVALNKYSLCPFLGETGIGKTVIVVELFRRMNFDTVLFFGGDKSKWESIISRFKLNGYAFNYRGLSRGANKPDRHMKGKVLVILDECHSLKKEHKFTAIILNLLKTFDSKVVMMSATFDRYRAIHFMQSLYESSMDMIMKAFPKDDYNPIIQDSKLKATKICKIGCHPENINDFLELDNSDEKPLCYEYFIRYVITEVIDSIIVNHKYTTRVHVTNVHIKSINFGREYFLKKIEELKVRFDLNNYCNYILKVEAFSVPTILQDMLNELKRDPTSKAILLLESVKSAIEYGVMAKLDEQKISYENIIGVKSRSRAICTFQADSDDIRVLICSNSACESIDLDDKCGRKRHMYTVFRSSNSEQILGRINRLGTVTDSYATFYTDIHACEWMLDKIKKKDTYEGRAILNAMKTNIVVDVREAIITSYIDPPSKVDAFSLPTISEKITSRNVTSLIKCVWDRDWVATLPADCIPCYVDERRFSTLNVTCPSTLGIYVDYVIRYLISYKRGEIFYDDRAQVSIYTDNYKRCAKRKVIEDLYFTAMSHNEFFGYQDYPKEPIDISLMLPALDKWACKIARMKDVELNPAVGNKELGIRGDCDIIANDTIIDIKCNSKLKASFEQLLVYKALWEFNGGNKINTLIIYNPLYGAELRLDVSNYNQQSEILERMKKNVIIPDRL